METKEKGKNQNALENSDEILKIFDLAKGRKSGVFIYSEPTTHIEGGKDIDNDDKMYAKI